MNKKREPLRTDKGRKRDTIELHPTVPILATYVLLLLSKIIDITLVNRENELFSVVILQMMIFLLPGAIWCMFSGDKYTKKLRLALPTLTSLPLILSATFMMISGGLLLSLLLSGFGTLSQSFTLYDTFVSKTDGSVPSTLYLILAYALLPAICEEFIYRGIACAEFERGGVIRAIFFSSLFFGMLHFNIRLLPVYIFCGIILAMTLYSTRSLLGAVIAHFLYNLFGLFGQPYLNSLYNLMGSSRFFVFILIATLLASTAVFCALAAKLYKGYLYRGYSSQYRKPVITSNDELKSSYLDVISAPSAIACFILYIIVFIISLI